MADKPSKRETQREREYRLGLKEDKKRFGHLPQMFPDEGKRYAMDGRPVGSRWYGRPLKKRDILEAAQRAADSNGVIDKEEFANIINGFPGGSEGGYDKVRSVSFQVGEASETESKGAGKGRREKRRGR